MKPCLAAGFFTGPQGVSIGCFYIGKGLIVGFDVGGGDYKGSYTETGSGSFAARIEMTLPANTATITGMRAEQQMKIPFEFILPPDFLTGKVIRLESPIGSINCRFELKHEIP